MSDLIQIFQGELLEGETVELYADFSCNNLSNFFTKKRWLVLGEKDLQFNPLTQTYYNDVGKKNIFENVGDDYITMTELKVGRYLAVFSYTDLRGNVVEEQQMFTVFPRFELIFDRDITEGDTKNVNVSTTLLNTTSTVVFGDDGGSITIDETSVDRTFPLNGYHTATVTNEYSEAQYDEVGEPEVIWLSFPSDRLVTGGKYGGATKVDGSFTNDIEVPYLTKLKITSESLSDKINVNVSVGFNGTEAFAPITMYVTDLTNYFTLSGDQKQYWDYTKNFPTDSYVPRISGSDDIDTDFFLPLDEAFEGDNRIDYTEIFFGDGQVVRGRNIDFTYEKTYYKSGKYELVYNIYTRQYIDLTVEDENTLSSGLIKDVEDGRLYYTNKIEYIERFEVGAFFTKWLREHVTTSLYNNDGFNDITVGVGKQLDRLYNEGQSIIESIDVETINDKFIAHYFETYGDFKDIAKKVGFLGFTKDREDIYDFFQDYNFFDRVESGKVTDEEKAEFLTYVRTTQARLQTKGTPASIERELAQFGIIAQVVELWTDNMDRVSSDADLLDEVFSGKSQPYETGLTYEASSTPVSDNTESLIANSSDNAYIEINSRNIIQRSYYTKDTPISQIDCRKYAVFDEAVSKAEVLDYVFETLFDKWADSCIGEGLWARKYKSTFETFKSFTWIQLQGTTWGEDVIDTLNSIGTNELYKEFVTRFGEMGALIWEDFNLETWATEIEALTTFVQGVSGDTVLSLQSGEVVFGDYSETSFDVGTILYFNTTGKLTSAYIKDVHGVQEDFECVVEGVSGAEWGTTLADAITYGDGKFHYRVTIPSKTEYYKGWVFNKDDGVVFTTDAQFRLECDEVDILTVTFEEEVEEVVEVVSNLNTFKEANFRCEPIIPTNPEDANTILSQEFADNTESSRMEVLVGVIDNASTISAFNKCVQIGDRTRRPTALSEGEYAYFGTDQKLTRASVKDIQDNEMSLEYYDGTNFRLADDNTDFANVVDHGGVFFYRWRVPSDNFIFSETEAFTFKSTKNFNVTIYNQSIFDTLVAQANWTNTNNIEWGQTERLTWEDLFQGDQFGNIIYIT